MSQKKDFLVYSVVSASIGALIAFGLSFTNVSPLVMGGIIGATLPALAMFWAIGYLACVLFSEGKLRNKDALFFFGSVTIASAAVGVGLAVVTSACGVKTGTVLTGAAIGALSPVIGFFAFWAMFTAAERVNEYMVSPVVEKVKECLSLQEEK